MEGERKGIDLQAGVKALAFSTSFFLLSGIVTTTIPNPVFTRMIPLNWWDYFFWIATSILLLPITYFYLLRSSCKECQVLGAGGTFGGLLSFSCPICSKLLVLALGVSGALAFDTYRPLLGAVSLALLLFALYVITRKK